MGLMLGSTQINSLEVFKKGSSEQDVWTPPEDWPNIRKMLAEDNGHGYTYVAYVLFAADYYPSVQLDYTYWRTSDGHEYRWNQTHYWDDPTAKYGWVAMYSNSPFTYTKHENNFGQSLRALWICFNFDPVNFSTGYAFGLQSIECPNALKYTGSNTRSLANIISLKNIPNAVDLSESTDCSQIFTGCYALTKVPDELDISRTTSTINMFSNCYVLKNVPDTLDMRNSTNAASMFDCCYSLQNLPAHMNMINVTTANRMCYACFQLKSVPREIVMPKCTNCEYMFLGCQTLTKLPERIILDECTNCSGMFSNNFMAQVGPTELHIPKCKNCSVMFNNCLNLKNLPDVINIAASTNNGAMFDQCASLEHLPTHLTANASISFISSGLVSKDSVATFDSDGNISGGMVYNLNTCSASGQTISFSSNTKNKFTSDEWTKVKAMLSSKNWGYSPA